MTALEEAHYAAKNHADLLHNDVELAPTRESHIRVSARANEARNIANDLYTLVVKEAAAGHELP